MLFHNARSSGVMPLLTAMRNSVWPFCTFVVAPYLGCDFFGIGFDATAVAPPPPEGVRTTVLVPQAVNRKASDAAATPAGIRLKLALVPIRPFVMSFDPFGPARSAAEPLEQFAYRHATAADQHTEIDDGADVEQMPQQYRNAIALDEAQRIREQCQGWQGIAEWH